MVGSLRGVTAALTLRRWAVGLCVDKVASVDPRIYKKNTRVGMFYFIDRSRISTTWDKRDNERNSGGGIAYSTSKPGALAGQFYIYI